MGQHPWFFAARRLLSVGVAGISYDVELAHFQCFLGRFCHRTYESDKVHKARYRSRRGVLRLSAWSKTCSTLSRARQSAFTPVSWSLRVEAGIFCLVSRHGLCQAQPSSNAALHAPDRSASSLSPCLASTNVCATELPSGLVRRSAIANYPQLRRASTQIVRLQENFEVR